MTPRSPQSTAESRESVSKGHGAKSSVVRQKAILALLSEPTIGCAAKRAGIGERTLRTWMSEDSEFKAAYESARHATYEWSMSRIFGLTARAIDTLEELLKEMKHPSVRLGASRTVAEIAMHVVDSETILKRLDEIEAAQQRNRRS